MTEGERKMGEALRAVVAVSEAEAAEFIDALERQDTLMPFMDPTTYLHRGGAGVTGVALELAREFLAFRQEVERIRGRAMARGFASDWLKFALAQAEAAERTRRP